MSFQFFFTCEKLASDYQMKKLTAVHNPIAQLLQY
jgi:hypothetical protein